MLYEYKVEIEESLCKTFTVRAENPIQAIQYVNEKYYEEEIVLYADDCMGVIFGAKQIEKKEHQ